MLAENLPQRKKEKAHYSDPGVQCAAPCRADSVSPHAASSPLSYSYHPCLNTYFCVGSFFFLSCLFLTIAPVIPVLLTVGVIFSPSPKSPCGLKSNLSDFTYDGLKQVSVFKALKVTWEKPGCMHGSHPASHLSLLFVSRLQNAPSSVMWSW